MPNRVTRVCNYLERVAHEDPAKDGNRWITLVAVTGQLMVVIDIAVVNVATPTIRSALGFSAPGVQWVASAYTLAFTGFLLVGGRAADIAALVLRGQRAVVR
jgi:MFS family permease